ncbi:hypothetical protein CTI12_AA594850 [Artemisia annua]|uniref:Ulp1 protease family, C-terminal catalytic domain-containing protein n=1 Tax=Artemisia annua TaxID=35608 RepID=A0A2U1KJV5_ARTAN|nr:hypothetical protein CTI12_AA594850 [Artemisia annua]
MKNKDADDTVMKQYMTDTETEEEDDETPTPKPTKKRFSETEEKVSDSDVDDAMKNVSSIPFLSETSKATKSKAEAEKARKAAEAEEARKAAEAEKARKAAEAEEARKAAEEEAKNVAEEEEKPDIKGKRKLSTRKKMQARRKKKPKFTVDESPKRVTRSTPKTTEESEEDSEKEKSDEDEKEITDNEEEVIPQKQTRASPKKPEKNETTTVYRTCRTRSSPKPLCDATSNLSNERKRCLKEMRFETMINFPLNELPGSLGFYVLENFHPNSMELRLEKGSIKVTRQKVHDMLGVPMGSRKLDEMEPREWNDEFITRWEQQYYKLGKKKKATPALIAKEINRTSNADFMFKINFLMLFASTMGTLDSGGKCPYNVLRNVKEDDDIADIDCKHNWKDVKKSGNYYYGPLTLLNLLYLDSTHFPELQVMRHRPAIRSWNTAMMKQRIELEKKQKCLGKLEHHGEFNQEEDQSGCINLYQGADVYFEEEIEDETSPATKEDYYRLVESSLDRISKERKEMLETLVEGCTKYNEDRMMYNLSKRYMKMFNVKDLLIPESASDDDSDDENEDNSDNDEEENVEYKNEEREDEKSENEEMEYEMLDSEKQVDDQMGDEKSNESDKDDDKMQEDLENVDVSVDDAMAENVEKQNEAAVNEPAVDKIGVDEPKVQEVELVDETAVEEQKDQEPAVEQPAVEEHMPAVKEPAVEEPEKQEPKLQKTQFHTPQLKLDSQEEEFWKYFHTHEIIKPSEEPKKPSQEDDFWYTHINSGDINETIISEATKKSSPLKSMEPGPKTDVESVTTQATQKATKNSARKQSKHNQCKRGNTGRRGGILKKERQHSCMDMMVQDDYVSMMEPMYKDSSLKQTVELAFFPIIAHHHYYLVVFNLLKGTSVIIDNSNSGQTYDAKYKHVCDLLHLERYKHPKASDVRDKKTTIMKLKWGTKNNEVDCGVFVMMHMENYNGETATKWNLGFPIEEENQTIDLIKMRVKYATKMLMHEVNKNREMMSENAHQFARQYTDKDEKQKMIKENIKKKKAEQDAQHVPSAV